MARAWEAEREVSVDSARSLIAAQFPEIGPVHIVPLAVGWDNTAFRVNDDFVFRFPRRTVAVDLIEMERRLLPALAPTLPLPISVPIMMGSPSDGFEWPFAGYRYLPGRTACAARLGDAQRTALARPLGEFLAALHAFPVIEAQRLGAAGDTIGRLDLSKRIPRTRENLRQLVQLGLVEDDARWHWVISEAEGLEPARGTSLVHGDLYALHILVDEAFRICGVIDWGDAHVGDPAVDLSIAHGLLPASAHKAFRAAYGVIGDETWRLARFRGLYHATVTTWYATQIGDRDLLDEGIGVLERLKRA